MLGHFCGLAHVVVGGTGSKCYLFLTPAHPLLVLMETALLPVLFPMMWLVPYLAWPLYAEEYDK